MEIRAVKINTEKLSWLRTEQWSNRGNEVPIIHRDSRVYTLSFSYRFGKAYKTIKQADSTSDEAGRVGNG